MRALIVDDNFISRKLLKEILAPVADCDIAIDGKEAILAFQLAWEEKRPYDLVCMDIMMPNVDGLEALKRIRSEEVSLGVQGGDEVKVLMVSALGDPKTVVDAYYKGGATDYLVKPVRKESLYAELRKFGLLK